MVDFPGEIENLVLGKDHGTIQCNANLELNRNEGRTIKLMESC